MRRPQRLIATAVLVALSGALAGCGSTGNFDPSDLLDFLDTKKKLPGERKPVFPDGVPGLEQGVPKDLYRGARQQQRMVKLHLRERLRHLERRRRIGRADHAGGRPGGARRLGGIGRIRIRIADNYCETLRIRRPFVTLQAPFELSELVSFAAVAIQQPHLAALRFARPRRSERQILSVGTPAR